MTKSIEVEKSSEEFWQQYYAGLIGGDSELVEQPSPFATWVLPRLKEHQTRSEAPSLLEIGCGNGRDAVFFAKCGIQVTATDRCPEAIKLTASKLPVGSCAEVATAGTLPDKIVDYAFVRFVLHSMNEREQGKLLGWVRAHVRRALFIETRSVKDPRCGRGTLVEKNAYIDTHYRRFMSIEDLERAAHVASLDVRYCDEGSSGSGSDGAVVIRAELYPLATMMPTIASDKVRGMTDK